MFRFIKVAMAVWGRDIRGVTAIEYSLIAGAISLALITAIFLTGDSLVAVFSGIASDMGDAEENVSN